jgi:hypothetical protein
MTPDFIIQEAGQMQLSQGQAPQEGISYRDFHNYMDELRWQPTWRNEADKAVDYYDGNQLDPETLAALEAKGMGPLINNVIAPVVNVVLGMEAKTRNDWRVTGDDDNHQMVAEAMSAKLLEVERETRADRGCADAYAGQVKAGLGWVEVSRSANPFEYPYRAEALHRREMYWDWRDQSPDLHRARFQIRKRWYDVDQASAFFPRYADILKDAVGDPYRYNMRRAAMGSTTLNQSFEFERGLDLEDFEQWRQMDRKRICLYELWYRQWLRGYVMKTQMGDVIEFEPNNPVHKALYNYGQVTVEEAVYSRMRMAIYAGPHKLHDCPVKGNHSPYVPFWGYREDRTGVPYGLIRAMISPQDEVNARRQKMMWLLGAKRVLADSDAIDPELNDWDTVMQEIGRPDALILLNKARMNKGGFQVDDNLQLAQAQLEVLRDAKETIHEVSGVFSAQMGNAASSQSGTAINSLVEQGMMALAEINDNYRYARRMVGERLLELIREDMIGQQVSVVSDISGKRRTISLNTVMIDPATGQQMMINSVKDAKIKVALEDVPSTPSYRAQQFTMLSEVMKGMPPQLQAAIAPFWMEASDLPKRKLMADAMRKILGQNVDPSTPEEAQAMQEAQAQQAELAAYNKQMAMAELAKRQADVNKINAEAEKIRAEASGNPSLNAARGEFETAIATKEAQARERIDELTVEIMTMRNAAAVREASLTAELGKLKAAATSAEANAAAEVRKAEIEREIADINAKKDVEVAKLNQDKDDLVGSMGDQMKALRDEFIKRFDDLARMEQEEKQREANETREPAAAPVINVGPIVIENKGGAKTIEIKKVGDKYVGSSSTQE